MNCPCQESHPIYMSIKLTCTKVHSNHSAFPEYLGYVRSNNDTSLLVSPLVVAGIVIGLVLFLSCVTIIIGSLRKDGGVRDWHLEAEPSYDGISYAASIGDLRSACPGDLTPTFGFGSYLELNVSYPDAPPCYEDCVGEGAMELYPPTDDPPPYSLENPHLSNELALSIGTEDTPWTTQESSGHLLPTPLLSSLWLHFAPPYRTRSKMSVHSPVISVDA
ncbi:hypothetical protein XENTR_v10011476 [Xenopus tropicalis]|uniref:Protein BEAN1 n=1 Tax=Xenopus tropicalis TaxID=8364 RepID=A0A8J0QNH1_XENTR|nr:protein BEAN1 [Xenopus tropicalis]KAE8608352.1 hypothetical protein XENTR_v10011476 [Xenopus tropicalis]|eukprot:XP_002933694.1 PREDICTED: protein BEAN1 [Xenopus tropicalis]